MSVTIKPIPPLKKYLKQYVHFGIDLYRDNKYFVPPLVLDEINTLLPEKNPAFDFCQAQSYMAYRDGKPVGRITGIINQRANEKFAEKTLRFGFVDFIDDDEVVDALFRAIQLWGHNHGMTKIAGPMGFTDMDREGMLVDGFEELGTQATIYNYPYYVRQMERLGFAKEADWIEYRINVPEQIPERYARIADIVARKFNLRPLQMTSRKAIAQRYGQAIFELINRSYGELYGFVSLTQKQIDHYIDMYLGLLRLEDVCLVVDAEDTLVGVGISMPSLSKALQRSGGRLFPTGWYHLLRAIRGHADTVDLMLIAIAPEYQGKGVNALLFSTLIPQYVANGYKYAESNVELESNSNVQKQWEYFERRQHRRRRSWSKALDSDIR